MAEEDGLDDVAHDLARGVSLRPTPRETLRARVSPSRVREQRLWVGSMCLTAWSVTREASASMAVKAEDLGSISTTGMGSATATT